MRLLRLRPVYFRGFGQGEWVDVNNDLVILHGPNGFGKSSLAEAIEWLLYGETERRRSGERDSKRDYQASYRNVHAPDREETCVEAEFLISEHRCLIQRTLRFADRGAESSITYIDGKPAPFGPLGIDEQELFKPIVQQQSLQYFIHRPPKERRDIIGAALGLGPLVRLKTVIDRARTRFQQNPPAEVVAGRQKLQMLAQIMAQSDATSDLGARWSQEELDPIPDAAKILQVARDFLGTPGATWEESTEQLRLRRATESRRIFDHEPLIPPNVERQARIVGEGLAEVEERRAALAEALRRFIDSAASIYSREQLSLWSQGLRLAFATGTDTCPMCEAPTLTRDKRGELERRIAGSAAYTAAVTALDRESGASAAAVGRLVEQLQSLFPAFLEDGMRLEARQVFAANMAPLERFLVAHDTARQSKDAEIGRLATVVRNLRSLPAQAGDARTIGDATGLVGSMTDLANQVSRACVNAAQLYTRAYGDFVPALETTVASAGAVQAIDARLAPLARWNHILAVAVFNDLLKEALEAQRALEVHIQAKQNQLFTSRGREINGWYDLLCPGADVRYDRMEPATDALTLWGKSFGVDLNAAACLSHSQLNCLGLSVHLMRALTPDSPFCFLMLDDPVQSLDEEHYQALVISVIQQLIDTKRQVLVLTHERTLADDLWNRYYLRAPLYLRISAFTKSGPVIENAETWDDALSKADSWAKGNEDHRRVAVGALRRAAELMIRTTSKVKGIACPKEGSAKDLLPLFRSIKGVTVAQGNELETAIGFANPGTHTEEGWAPPPTQHIIPRVQALFRLGKELGLPRAD